MSDITQIDREAAAAYMKLIGDNRWSQNGILSGGCDNTSVTLAFAAHRIAAEKANDVALATAYQCGYDTAEERTEKAVLDRLRQDALNEGIKTESWVLPAVDGFETLRQCLNELNATKDALAQADAEITRLQAALDYRDCRPMEEA